MSKSKIKLFYYVWIILLSTMTVGMAEDIYVRESAAGSDTGVDGDNAHSLGWVNSAANWGPGADLVSPGDIVHLVGTFTSALVVAGSGTSGSPVTFLFESGAQWTAGTTPTGGAIQIPAPTKEFITIDGGVDGGVNSAGSIAQIEATDTGTGLQQVNNFGISGGGSSRANCNNLIITNMTIKGMYTNILHATPALRDEARFGYNIVCTGSNVTIEDCRLSDGDGLLTHSSEGGGATGLTIKNNIFLRWNHAINFGASSNPLAKSKNMNIEGNLFDDSYSYDGPPGGPRHLDGIIFVSEVWDLTNTAGFDNIRIHRNHFGDQVGQITTAAIFSSISGGVVMNNNWYIYNNLFECSNPGSWGNGFVAVKANNIHVFNNTYIAEIDGGSLYGGSLFGGGGPTARVKNNLAWGTSGMSLHSSAFEPFSTVNDGANTQILLAEYFDDTYSDYNAFVNPIANPPQFGFVLWPWAGLQPLSWASGNLYNVDNWQTWYNNSKGMVQPIWNIAHADPNSVQFDSAGTVPVFKSGSGDQAFIPEDDDTLLRGQGENLTSTFAEMTTNFGYDIPAVDYNGNSRPAAGAWTIGAFEDPDPGMREADATRKPRVPFSAAGGGLTAPFVAEDDAVFQPAGTGLADSGRATYSFTVDAPGDYGISMLVDTPTDAANSFFVNVDAEPQDPQMIWDILPLTVGLEARLVSWRGTGTFSNNQYTPKYFNLGVGPHELIIRGREANAKIKMITISKRPKKVSTLTSDSPSEPPQ